MTSTSVPSLTERRAFLSFSDFLQFPRGGDTPFLFSELDGGDVYLAGKCVTPGLTDTPTPVLNRMCEFLNVCLHGASRQFAEEYVTTLVDSGANCHVLSYEDALKLLQDQVESQLNVTGVDGSTTRADVKGRLIVTLVGSSGREYKLDLGTAHGMKGCPVNLLSLSLLLDVGAVLHFEKGDCWIQPPSSLQGEGVVERIPLQQKGGLFQVPLKRLWQRLGADDQRAGQATTASKHVKLDVGDPSKFGYLGVNDGENVTSPFTSLANPARLGQTLANPARLGQTLADPARLGQTLNSGTFLDEFSCSLYGRSFLAGDLDLWHRRMRHVSKQQLKKINALGLVDGFNMTGNANAHCGCDTCAQANIKRARNERQRHYSAQCKFIGHHVSSDVKSLPYESFEGYKYAICFVDHYSRLGICYMMRTKDEAVEKFKLYQKELAFYGYRVMHLHSDRGSEYFSQEGELLADRDRALSALDQYCASQSPIIKHKVTPVEAKEKIAEAWFKDHFDAADAMLFEARLSPAFWADAVLYSQYLYNRMPNLHTGTSTPFEMLTGKRARWDKIRVFGADAYMLIPNDDMSKVPGIVKGKKVIFVGFSLNCNGYRVFDPEARRYSTVSNIVFYESFKHRIDALRHHDKRREIMKKGGVQPVQLNDFEDENAKGVRNLFTDPDP